MIFYITYNLYKTVIHSDTHIYLVLCGAVIMELGAGNVVSIDSFGMEPEWDTMLGLES